MTTPDALAELIRALHARICAGERPADTVTDIALNGPPTPQSPHVPMDVTALWSAYGDWLRDNPAAAAAIRGGRVASQAWTVTSPATDYAWIIDVDHIFEPGDPDDIAGVGAMGPSDAPDWLTDHLASTTDAGNRTLNGRRCQIRRFTMHDDDKILYYSGRMISAEVDGPSEDACYAPLRDFGAPNAGAVTVLYPGHPDMDCG